MVPLPYRGKSLVSEFERLQLPEVMTKPFTLFPTEISLWLAIFQERRGTGNFTLIYGTIERVW